MIDAGLPLVQCLDILGQQQDNKIFQKIILQVRQDVEGGSSLAEAMRKHPPAFDVPVYVVRIRFIGMGGRGDHQDQQDGGWCFHQYPQWAVASWIQ